MNRQRDKEDAQHTIDFPAPRKPATQPLVVSRFDPKRAAWLETDRPVEDVMLSGLTCATFNTWFQGPEPALRFQGLLRVLERTGADVIMLQEVTMQLLEALTSTSWVSSRYCFTRAPFRADAIPSHGVMMLSRLPLRNATLHPLPTHMGRNLLTAECSINGSRFVFATAHLESMKPNADVRGRQLQTLFTILEEAENAVLAGDFNFCSSWPEENSRLDSRYVDVWPCLRPTEPGFTQDTGVNAMLARAKGEDRKLRIDRILLRSDSARHKWTPQSVQLLGTAPVSVEHSRIFPSDHFGVAATFSPKALPG